MTGATKLIVVIVSMAVGVAAGLGFAPRSAGDLDSVAAEKRVPLGSAVPKLGGRQNANDIARLLEDRGDWIGETNAWERVISLQLPELIAMLRDLEGRGSRSIGEGDLLQLGLERWISLDPAGALAWVESSHSTRIAREYRTAFTAFAEHDLEAALARLEEGIVPQKFRIEAMRGLMEPFAAADPQRAADFFDKLDRFDPLRGAGLRAAMVSWAESDPTAALEYCQESLARSGSIRSILSVWAGADAGAAKTWVVAHGGDEPYSRDLYARVVSDELVKVDPAGALAVYDDYPVGVRRNQKVERVLEKWGETDPAAAVEWARSLEDLAARSSAIKTLASALGASEPELALELADSLPSADSRNRAFVSYAEARAKEDPRGALDWAETVEDPGRRRTAVTTSVGVMANQDLLGATRYAIGTEDPVHKREMVTHIFDGLGEGWDFYYRREKHAEMRTISAELDPADERLAVDAMLSADSGTMQILPAPLLKRLKESGDLDVLIDWVGKEMGWEDDSASEPD